MCPQTVSQYRKAFQRKKGESQSAAHARCESRIPDLLKQGKLVEDVRLERKKKSK